MIFVPRAAWGARPPRSVSHNVDSKGITIHYSGSDADEQSNHATCAARVKGIQNFHMDSRGWADIAYSFVACKHGAVFEGRGFGVRTAANGTNAGNQSDLALCFLGDDTQGRDDVTSEGRAAIREFIDQAQIAGQVGPGVRGHRDWKATSCPGDELYAWIKAGLPVGQEEDLKPDERKWLADLHRELVSRQGNPEYPQGAGGDIAEILTLLQNGAGGTGLSKLDLADALEKAAADLRAP